MIEKDSISNIDEDAREYFNNSSLSGQDTLFNKYFYDCMLDSDSKEKYSLYDYEHYILLFDVWYCILGLNESNVSLSRMKKFIEYGFEYMDFAGKKDKLMDIKHRIHELNKDFEK